MARRYIAVTILVEVESSKELKEAAAARAVAEGQTKTGWRETRSGAGDDLIMLLDPGSLPGCSIIQTSAEEEN